MNSSLLEIPGINKRIHVGPGEKSKYSLGSPPSPRWTLVDIGHWQVRNVGQKSSTYPGNHVACLGEFTVHKYPSQTSITDHVPKDSALHHPIESVLTLKPRTHFLAEALPHFQSYFQLLTHLPAMQARTWITQTLEVAILNTAICLSCLLNFASVHLTCFDSVGLWVLFYQQGDYVVN